ncbi:MAG: N-acetylmuramoyl-L-alanine amidase AmiC precursor [Deltaproteobacteria bacterium ADurb.Bin072]|jgi:N-acetylmuramoyl-L-alanine amidase|nr:MAG: N-acetylmuramoyl-L-alanine amidase AmiC precursor [Deltaproteobacteria bacterium ADurb.Bin072]
MDYLLKDVMDYIGRKRGSVLRTLLIISCMCAVSLPLHAASSAAQAYQSASAASVELLRDLDKKKDRVSWMAVIHKYQNVGKQYPRSNYAPRSWFKVGKLYEGLHGYSSNPRDLERAIEAYMTVTESYPSSSLADDAIYHSARIYQEGLSSPQKAYTLYQKVIKDFPKGDMAQLAREQMNSLNIEKKTITGDAKTGLGDVKTVRQWSDKDYTRVVVDLDENIGFKTFTLPADPKADRPDRVVIELDNAKVSRGLPGMNRVNDGILTNIRVSQYQSTKVRIVLDLAQKISYRAFPLAGPNRLVVDIIKDGASPVIAHEPSSANSGGISRNETGNGFKKVPKWSKSQMEDDVPSIATQLSLKVSRIVIDPGHGGKDPGAVGPGGVLEKDLVLGIGKALARRLRLEGFEVFMTRDSDVFLTLEERTAFANKKRADLFVSIHINAHNNKGLQGIETYFLNLTTDASAIEVAARENATTSKSISDLQLIINDLMLNSKINESSRFASSVHKCVMSSVLNTGYQGKDLGVKQAPFYVLLGAQMPSILCELGFITNGTEASLLQCESHQSTLIDGIAKGINKYIMNTTYAYMRRK